MAALSTSELLAGARRRQPGLLAVRAYERAHLRTVTGLVITRHSSPPGPDRGKDGADRRSIGQTAIRRYRSGRSARSYCGEMRHRCRGLPRRKRAICADRADPDLHIESMLVAFALEAPTPSSVSSHSRVEETLFFRSA